MHPGLIFMFKHKLNLKLQFQVKYVYFQIWIRIWRLNQNFIWKYANKHFPWTRIQNLKTLIFYEWMISMLDYILIYDTVRFQSNTALSLQFIKRITWIKIYVLSDILYIYRLVLSVDRKEKEGGGSAECRLSIK